MTTEQKIIQMTVGVLELAKQLDNVSKACRLMGCGRPAGDLPAETAAQEPRVRRGGTGYCGHGGGPTGVGPSAGGQ